MYIENINGPDDVKVLTIEECSKLASEIREALIKRTSLIGGHVGSNLGMVEASIALHKVFNAPKDKLVFDVSHQCYTHKIITGRSNAFLVEEEYNNVCGYTSPEESEFDHFQVGHTSTSISLAAGLAMARNLKGSNENVIAIIGDGSLSGGEAFEGLDFVGSEIPGNFIVIVNDNQMSISDNHGGLYKNLKQLRESKGQAECNYFKALGFKYYYVDDGNDMASLVENFEKVKNCSSPVVVHIVTTKGKEYKHAELNKEAWHWRRPFDINSGELKNDFNGERYDRITRDFLLEKMDNDPLVTTVIAAVPDSIAFTQDVRLKAGKQFVDVGIAEEHAIAMVAGMAKNGAKPVFATMSTFFQRTYDQISQELCINKLSATLLVINASVYAVNDITHIGIFDLSLMSNIPNLVCLSPTNKEEYLAMLDWSIEQDQYPVAIRAPRNGVFHSNREVDKDYSKLNKYKIVNKGEKVAILALGDFYQIGEELSELVKNKLGFNPTLVNPRYSSGIDEEMLMSFVDHHDTIITLEDGILDGGFGQKVASFMGKIKEMKVLNYGLKKEFIDRYNVDDILMKNRLKPELIVEDIIERM